MLGGPSTRRNAQSLKRYFLIEGNLFIQTDGVLFFTFSTELHMIGDHDKPIAIVPFLVDPAFLAKPPYDPHFPAFAQIIRTVLGKLAPYIHRHEEHFFDALPFLIPVVPIGSDGELREHRFVACKADQLRITYEIAFYRD